MGDEPFAVILTDDVIMGEPPCLQQMIEAYQDTGGSMVATMEVPLDNQILWRARRGRGHGRHRPRQGHGRKAQGNPPLNLHG